MKSLFKSNISWFMILSLFQFLKPAYAMDENKTKINSYSVNQLQNDFIGLKKNPQKYVKFQLNTEKTIYPDAGGLYELLPHYQKINPLGEKANYKIQWCDFEQQFQLIKVNPLGDLPRLNVEQTTIATLLEGDQFSRPTNADIKAYTTYEKMKSVVRSVGEINKEQKIKIIKMEKEVDHVQTKSKVEIACERKKYEKLKEKLTKSIEQNQKHLEKIQKFKADAVEQNQKFKTYELEQTYITEKENEKNTSKVKKYEEALEKIEELKLDLKEKQTEIEKQNKENRALEYQKGDLSYKLSDASEFKQKFLNLEKETYPLKVQIEQYQTVHVANIKAWNQVFVSLKRFFNCCAKICFYVSVLTQIFGMVNPLKNLVKYYSDPK